LISLSNLGDIILTTPVFQALSAAFPEAEIDVVTGPAGSAIFRGHPSLRDIILTNRHRSLPGRMALVKELRKKRYDMAVDLKNTLMPFVVGARYKSTGFLLKRDRKRVLHKKDEHLLKLHSWGIDEIGGDFYIPVTKEDIKTAEVLLAGSAGKIAVVCPGAKSHLKRWGYKDFAGLCDRLAGELECSILIAGNADDRDTVDRFLSFVKVPVKDICGKTTIGTLAEIMRRASLVVTNDSAPLHVASAVNAPTLAIFGPSDERKYGPLSRLSKVVKPNVSCRPCERALCSTGPAEGCIINITVDEVFGAAKELLGKDDTGHRSF
jgi:ADP-heptose:LPS heptosyltransferase